jgi:alpha-galactosidase
MKRNTRQHPKKQEIMKRTKHLIGMACLGLLLMATGCRAPVQEYDNYAPSPPMGWNSFDAFITSINEEQYRANVDYIAEHLKPYGYQYAVIDAGWYQKAISDGKVEYLCDEHGRPIPHPHLFPSAANGAGFTPLADYVHGKGLKFGVHLMRGMSLLNLNKGYKVKGTDYLLDDVVNLNSKCPWSLHVTAGVKVDHPGSQAWYNSLFELLAEWGVDFVKYDDVASPLHLEELIMIRKAIELCGREIVLSLSPGDFTQVSDAPHYSKYSAMWRISSDFWDKWSSLYRNFNLLAQWNENFPERGWPDGDMLPIGYLTVLDNPRLTKFTTPELHSLMSLWCFARSPLILSCDLSRNTGEMLSIQTNRELININQHGEGNKVMYHDENYHVWYAKYKKKAYVALFNISDESRTIQYPLSELNLKARKTFDVWTKETNELTGNQINVTIEPHDCRVLRLEKR